MQIQLRAELIHEPCRRRTERRQTSDKATFCRGLRRVTVDILNLSLEGARLGTSEPFVVGSRIWLKLPMLASREAVVIWTSGSAAGCEFSEPLHPMVFEVITRAGAASGRAQPQTAATGPSEPLGPVRAIR